MLVVKPFATVGGAMDHLERYRQALLFVLCVWPESAQQCRLPDKGRLVRAQGRATNARHQNFRRGRTAAMRATLSRVMPRLVNSVLL